MAFTTNTSKAQETSAIKPEGDYECLIESRSFRVTPNGARSIGFRYVVRNDVEQQYKNALIFHDVWAKREPNEDDLMADGYNYAQLMAIAGAAGLPATAEYDSFEAFLDALVGKPVKVHIFHDEYNGKIREKVDKHLKTDFPKVLHKARQTASAASYAKPAAQSFAAAPAAAAPAAADDDDYPF